MDKMKNTDTPGSSIFVYPDPITATDMLSGAVFLYFDRPLILTLPPQIIEPASFELLDVIKKQKPAWSQTFLNLLAAWKQQQDAHGEVLSILNPLKNSSFKNVWVVYPADSSALERAGELIASTSLSLDSVAQLINPLNASGEIIRHILLEAYLTVNKDIKALFNYCGDLFAREPLPYLLTKGYFLRLPIFAQAPEKDLRILLTNPHLIKFLNALPVSATTSADESLDNDVIAWELFREILSPILDPLDLERSELIAEMLTSRSEEVDRLRQKCRSLADQVKEPKGIEEMISQVERLIRNQVQKEIADLLKLDREALGQFFVALFSDDKTWLSLGAFLVGIIGGHINITTGAAIAALSSVGAKAFKTAADKREKLKRSDYALVYNLSRRV